MISSNDYRSLADEYAKQMKYLFEESKKAWNSGDKANAKLFSNKGNEFKALMNDANLKFGEIMKTEKEKKRKIEITKNTITDIVKETNIKDFTNNKSIGFYNYSNDNLAVDDQLNEQTQILYDDYRTKANLFGDKMKEAFVNSQTSWREGDKQKAKEYSDMGYQYREKMQELNSYAVKLISKKNNYNKDTDEIDLHGLYVKEALEFFKGTLKTKLKDENFHYLKVITGKGSHSKDGPKIKIAIIELCQANNFLLAEDPSNEGCLFIFKN